MSVLVSVYKSMDALFWFSLVQAFHYAIPIFIHIEQHCSQVYLGP